MTLVLVIRSIEGIAIVTDSATTVQSTRIIDDEETPVEYHIYGRQKLAQIGDFGVVHAGVGFINKKTINQLVYQVKPDEVTFDNICSGLREVFDRELNEDPDVKELPPGYLIVSLGVVGYKDGRPFVHRIIYLKGEGKDLLEVIESEDTFNEESSPYGIDYFGDFEFIQLVIRDAKDRGLMKPFDILTLHETLELARTLMEFLVEFQRYLVKFTVAYPIESAVITWEEGFAWVDQMELKPFHYDFGDH